MPLPSGMASDGAEKGRSRPFIRHGTHLLVLLGIAAVIYGAFAAATGRERHSALD